MHFPDCLKNDDVKSTRFGVLIFVRFGVLTFLAHWETHNGHISHWILGANHSPASPWRSSSRVMPRRPRDDPISFDLQIFEWERSHIGSVHARQTNSEKT